MKKKDQSKTAKEAGSETEKEKVLKIKRKMAKRAVLPNPLITIWQEKSRITKNGKRKVVSYNDLK